MDLKIFHFITSKIYVLILVKLVSCLPIGNRNSSSQPTHFHCGGLSTNSSNLFWSCFGLSENNVTTTFRLPTRPNSTDTFDVFNISQTPSNGNGLIPQSMHMETIDLEIFFDNVSFNKLNKPVNGSQTFLEFLDNVCSRLTFNAFATEGLRSSTGLIDSSNLRLNSCSSSTVNLDPWILLYLDSLTNVNLQNQNLSSFVARSELKNLTAANIILIRNASKACRNCSDEVLFWIPENSTDFPIPLNWFAEGTTNGSLSIFLGCDYSRNCSVSTAKRVIDSSPTNSMSCSGSTETSSSTSPSTDYTCASNSSCPPAVSLCAIFGLIAISVLVLFDIVRRKRQGNRSWLTVLRNTLNSSIRETKTSLEKLQTPQHSYSGDNKVPDNLVVPKWRIEIDRGNVLGMGHFGKVYLGEMLLLSSDHNDSLAKGKLERRQVAVKTWKNISNVRYREEFYAEVDTMVRIGQYENIVALLGIYQEDDLCMILEYCCYGALDKVLKEIRIKSQKSPITLEPKRERKLNDYVDSEPLPNIDGEIDSKIISLVESDLVKICYQIARGMTYISSLGIIHRDLAARNILLDEYKAAKIADFGMAREDSEYILERVPLPVKWMAPESIKNRAFSSKSDVWSFGILMWEVFTFAENPYADRVSPAATEAFYKYIKDGARLERPTKIPDQLHQMMTTCWEWKPENRPTFAQLATELEGLVTANAQQNYVVYSSPVDSDGEYDIDRL